MEEEASAELPSDAAVIAEEEVLARRRLRDAFGWGGVGTSIAMWALVSQCRLELGVSPTAAALGSSRLPASQRLQAAACGMVDGSQEAVAGEAGEGAAERGFGVEAT